jgi:predicted ribosomally synthesized peptide with SipW-like signal peptide
MKKILGLTVSALMVMGLVGSGTWAFFSDTETSAGNTITAGTLNLQVGAADPVTANFTLTVAVPGSSGNVTWALDASGDVDGYLDVSFANLVDTENTVYEPETGDDDSSGELADNLVLEIFIDEDSDNTYDSGDGEPLIYSGNATSSLIAAALDDYSLPASASGINFVINWSIDTAVGNTIMSDIAGFDIVFELDQIAD